VPWIKPDYQEVSLGMEVTAYVNTDEERRVKEQPPQKEASPPEGDSARPGQA